MLALDTLINWLVCHKVVCLCCYSDIWMFLDLSAIWRLGLLLCRATFHKYFMPRSLLHIFDKLKLWFLFLGFLDLTWYLIPRYFLNIFAYLLTFHYALMPCRLLPILCTQLSLLTLGLRWNLVERGSIETSNDTSTLPSVYLLPSTAQS